MRPSTARSNAPWLVALTKDAESAVAPVEAEIADIGVACLVNPKTVESEQHGQCCALVSEVFRREEEAPELGAVHPCPWLGWTLGRRTYWAGFDAILPSMCANRWRPHTVASRPPIVDAANP